MIAKDLIKGDSAIALLKIKEEELGDPGDDYEWASDVDS